MLDRHVFISGEVIIIDISESECQFLNLGKQLIQSFIAAVTYDKLMEKLVVSDNFLDISFFYCILVSRICFNKVKLFFFRNFLSSHRSSHSFKHLANFQHIYHIFYGNV